MMQIHISISDVQGYRNVVSGDGPCLQTSSLLKSISTPSEDGILALDHFYPFDNDALPVTLQVLCHGKAQISFIAVIGPEQMRAWTAAGEREPRSMRTASAPPTFVVAGS